MRIRIDATTTLAALLIALALPAVAPAKSSFVIRGAGFGHGIGLSQYGADGYAQHGFDYRTIVGHYYEGTSLAQLSSSPTIRVLLESASAPSFSGATQAGDRTLNPAKTYSVVRAGGGAVALRSPSGRKLETFSGTLQVSGDGPLQLNGLAGNGVRNGLYRGALEFRPGLFSGVAAINAVGLEDYVSGVVSAESPSSWPAAALEAQSVAKALGGWNVVRLDGPAATRDATLAALPNARLLHYAGHARPGAAGPLSSALVLSGEGRIELGDLLAAPGVPELVILSACEAAGTQARQPSLMGLAQAFVAAGAAAALAPTQPVRDADARAFTAAFYRALETKLGPRPAAAPDQAVAHMRAALRDAVTALRAPSSAPPGDDSSGGSWESFRLLVP